MAFSGINIFILIIIGLVAGYLSGLMGLGGGIIIIPALVYLLGFSQQAAQGTTLALMVLPVGLIAANQYFKAGNVNIPSALIIAIAFVFASYFGSKTVDAVNVSFLRKTFSIMLFLIALKMFLQK